MEINFWDHDRRGENMLHSVKNLYVVKLAKVVDIRRVSDKRVVKKEIIGFFFIAFCKNFLFSIFLCLYFVLIYLMCCAFISFESLMNS